MIKKLLFITVLMTQLSLFVSCSNDEPDGGNGNQPSQENPGGKDELNIIINDDGTTSTGVMFRQVSATQFWLNYVCYTISGNHINVTGCDVQELKVTLHGHITIPASITIGGVKYYVRVISDLATENLKSIDIPSSVVEIGRQAFENVGLQTIELPNSVTKIGGYAFYKSSLETIKLPNSVTVIGERAFWRSKLNYIRIPDGVTRLEDATFEECPNLTTVCLPKSLNYVGEYYTFAYCPNLTSIYLMSESNPEGFYYERLFYPSKPKMCTVYIPKGCRSAYGSLDGFYAVEEFDPETIKFDWDE